MYLFISKETENQGISVSNSSPSSSSSSSLSATLDSSNVQPLDVFVGSSIRNFFREYLDNIESFVNYHPYPPPNRVITPPPSGDDDDDRDGVVYDRLWPKLSYAEDKLFYLIIEKSIHYLKGHPISDTPSPHQDLDDDDAVNEFGEMIRNDTLIRKRQKMFYEQQTLDIILTLLNNILPLVKGEYVKDVDFAVLENETSVTPGVGAGASPSPMPSTTSPPIFSTISISPSLSTSLSSATWNNNPNLTTMAYEQELIQKQKFKNLLKMSFRISKCLLRLLLQAIKRNPESQIYVSNHMHVVLGWVGIQQIAADVVKEMLSGNMELQTEHIGLNEIKIFTTQLTRRESRMNNMYFIMLRAFCSCNGSGISRNQAYVLEELLHISREVFVKIRQSSNADPINTQTYFLPSIYIPETIVETPSLMLGAQCLSEGLPYLSVTWQPPDEKYGPEALYKRKVIPIADMFRGVKAHLRSQISGSIGGVLGMSLTSPPGTPSPSIASPSTTSASALARRKSTLRKKSMMSQSLKEEITRDFTVERKEAVVEYMIAQLNLLGELCLERNISAITKIESLMPYEYLIAILSEQTLSTTSKSSQTSDLYGASAWLITNLYIDRESETTSRLPCHSKVWSSFETSVGGVSATNKDFITTVASDRLYRFGLLQHIISSHIKTMQGNNGKWEPYSLQFIMMMKKIVNLRFYGSIEKLRDIIEPLMSVLNRRNPELDLIIKQKSGILKSSRGGSVGLTLEDFAKLQQTQTQHWQKKCLQFMESLTELAIVMSIVFISTTVSILQMVKGYHGLGYNIFNILILIFFALEVSCRGYLHYHIRKKWSTFFLDHFVQLDIAIVILDVVVMASESALGTVGSFSGILRTLRLLRLIRVVRAARLLKVVVPKETGPVAKWVLPARYRTAPVSELQTMVCMVDVLRDVQRILDDRNLNLLLSGFRHWSEQRGDGNQRKDQPPQRESSVVSAGNVFQKILQNSQQISMNSDETDDILLDLLMYVQPDLVQSVLELLMAHHTSLATMLYNVEHTQLLISPTRESQYHIIQQSLLELDRQVETYPLWCHLLTTEEQEKGTNCEKILIQLRDLCRKRRKILEFSQDYEPDVEVQHLLRNLGCWDVCWKLLQKFTTCGTSISDDSVANNTSTSVATYAIKVNTTLLTCCNELLYWYGYDNKLNQQELFEQLNFFMTSVDRNIHSHQIITIIFLNNEELMRKVPLHYINDSAEMICKMGRFPQYLSLLAAITSVGEKNILENQYEIIKQISSPLRQKKILTFCCSVNSLDYQRKIKLMLPYQQQQQQQSNSGTNNSNTQQLQQRRDISPHEIASELTYHMDLLKVLAGCTMGLYNITTVETKVQAMFPYTDVIDAILDTRCLLVIKIQSGIFLYNSVLEVEMLIPGLAFSPKMWQLLESFVDILAPGKDLLRQIEKNGWDAPTSSRSAVEYLIVVSMIILGFFKLYFDPTTFRRDHLSTYGTQASTLKLSMNQIDSLILKLFDNLRSLYELDTPLLSSKQKQIFFDALMYLGRAKGMVLTEVVDMTHMNPITYTLGINSIDHRLEDDMGKKLQDFLEALKENSQVKEILDEEFQSIIQKISHLPRAADPTSTSTVRYEPILKKLVDHVRAGIEIVSHSNGREKQLNDRYTKTGIWIIQIFRTMIENAWGMSIYERDDDGGEEQDIASAEIVSTFNTCGVTTLCLDLIAIGIDRELVLECIKLEVAMLFKEGGALLVQKTIHKHLAETDSEFFFLLLKKIIGDLIAWHDWKKIAKSIIPKARRGYDMGTIESSEAYDALVQGEEEEEIPHDIIAIRFMQLMCEGHYGPNQDIMREQMNSTNSVNLLDDFVDYLVCISHIPGDTSTTAALAVGATILEVIQGPCEGNQDHFALNTTLIETLNHLLRARTDHRGLNLEDELSLKKTAIDIFQALLEGQGKKVAVYERVLSVIHLDVIQLMVKIPKTVLKTEKQKKIEKQKQKKLDQLLVSSEDTKLKSYLESEHIIGVGGKSSEAEEDMSEEDEEKIEEIKISLRTESLVLLQMLCDFKPILRNELEVLRESDGDNNSNTSGGDRVAYVEIMWRGELQRRFFNIPPICHDFTDASKSNFVEFVDRSSHENKLLDMYRRARVIYIELQHQKFIKEIGLNKIFSRGNQNLATWITFTLACAINIILLLFYQGEECFSGYDENMPTPVSCGEPSLGKKPRAAVNVLNYLQITFSLFTLVMFLIVRAPVQYISAYKQGRGVVRSILATALDPLTMYYFVYVILAIAAIKIDYLLTFFLLDIVVKNSYAMDVMVAVFTPIKQLTVAIGLTFIVMYIFAMFVVCIPHPLFLSSLISSVYLSLCLSLTQFLWLNDAGVLTTPADCHSLFSCWKFTLSYGSSGDFGANMLQKLDNQWIFYYLFDLAIRFVLLNVVRGITVDTFSELRLLKLERLKDTKEVCFICGIDKQVFDRDKLSKGFSTHISTEHNMWNYLFFMIHIWEQDKDDDDGLEQYVRRSIETVDINWIPAHKAMTLTVVAEGESENKTKENFNQSLIQLEGNFVSRMNQFQSDVSTAIVTSLDPIVAISTQPNTATATSREKKEYTRILSFNSLLSLGEEEMSLGGEGGMRSQLASRMPSRMLTSKSHTMSSINFQLGTLRGPTVVIEVNEITGLTFSPRILETLSCVIRTKYGSTPLALSATHLLPQESTTTATTVVFDPCEVVVSQGYIAELHHDELLTIQVTRGNPPRFVGKVEFLFSELCREKEQRLHKSFYGEVHEATSRGTVVINTNLVSSGDL
jgi:hypothetical protein